MTTLRVGARESPLSRWQAARIRAALERRGHRTEFIGVTTRGDRDRTTPLSRFGDPAVFSRELDDALLEGRIDLAVHSLKDLPVMMPAGIVLAAVGEREDPRDALVSRDGRGLAELRPGATVATSSLRRRAQLLRIRPDLEVVELRGNVEARLESLSRTPHWDGVVLAVAGLVRLGLGARISERLPLEVMLPAPGQGALAVTAREEDAPTRLLVVHAVSVRPALLATTAERAVLTTLDGGCHAPVSAHASEEAGLLRLTARVTSPDGRRNIETRRSVRAAGVGSARRLGESLAQELLEMGAGQILAGLPAMAVTGSP